jgi:hypothetical protein
VLRVWRQDEGEPGLGLKGQFDAFAARLMPILAEVGIDPGEPEVFEVHNIVKR